MNRRIPLCFPIRMPSFMRSARSCLRCVGQRLIRWRRLSYERRLLASLDDRMLRDIGVSRSDADEESRKPFWREH